MTRTRLIAAFAAQKPGPVEPSDLLKAAGITLERPKPPE